MGKTFLLLKVFFSILNLVVAIIGLVILGFAIKLSVDASQFPSNAYGAYDTFLVWPYLSSFGVLALSGLGVYGTFTQKKTPLIVFAVLMGIGTVVFFTHAINLTVVYYKMRHSIRDMHSSAGSVFNIMVAVFYGAGALALLGTVLSKLMVNQIKQSNGVL